MIELLFFALVLFFVIYWAIRLALKHERRSQIPNPHDVADQELRRRLADERQKQPPEAEA